MADGKTILVADDELNLRRVLGAMLKREGHQVLTAADGQEALGLLQKNEVHTVVTDLRMPRLDGMELLRRTVNEYPEVPVIILTAHGSVDNAVAAVKLGAFDYIEKPFEQDQIRQVVQKALKTNELRRSDVRLGEVSKGKGRYGLVGNSAAMLSVYNVVEKVADTPSTVLITGESGTGKELIAKALHEHSSRRTGPLIKVNCAAIPDTLIESELFGYEKGAFTGAVSSKPGRFELADKGTLFLDEIGEVPAEMQVKLLRALQENEFERVGGIKTLCVDVRVVAATNRDLVASIEHGRFREDLYYRLNVVPIHVPPLRERSEDIPDLVAHILEKFRPRLGKEVTEVTPEAMTALIAYHWPGNIRELENLLERTILFSDGPTIRLQDLPEPLRQAGAAAAPVPAASPSASTPALDGSLKEIVRAETERVERNLIIAALEETGGNVTHAAKRLKISRKSLQNKMKELGLRDGDEASGKKDV
ncbi:MAG: sigma-54-dependent Fis family transcriptional regulator [Deltaproteobacteria bacterium]|nr:sigma-54-dependent Fis family transcriptional regulator [Deltaproteobacteria bacterium]